MNFWQDIVDVQFVLSIIAICYYSCILMLMLTSKSAIFRSAFFRIYIVTGIFDILAVVAIEWIRADLKNGFGPQFEIASRIASAMTGTNFFTHIFGCFLMTVNRYTAACHPNIYEKYWSPSALYLLLFIDIAVAYAAHFPLFATKFIYEWRNDSWVFIGRERAIPTTRIMIASVATVYEILSIILIARTIYAIRETMKGQKARRVWQEMGLVMVTALDCLLGVLECIYEISALFGLINEGNRVIYWLTRHYKFYLFMIVTMNAYSIMFLSSSLRHEALRLQIMDKTKKANNRTVPLKRVKNCDAYKLQPATRGEPIFLKAAPTLTDELFTEEQHEELCCYRVDCKSGIREDNRKST